MLANKVFIQYRTLWLGFYILVNLLAGVMIYTDSKLMGDMNGVEANDTLTLVISILLICSFYYILLGPVFGYITRIKIPRITLQNETQSSANFGRFFNLLLIVLQGLFLIFNLSQGTNVAGNITESDSLWKYLWIFVPVDILFLVSYGYCRGNSLFKLSMLIFVVSNLQRGWGGALLIVIFFELHRLYLSGRFNLRKVGLLATVVLLLYPILQFLKWSVRSGGAGDGSLSMFLGLVGDISIVSYFESIWVGMEHVVGRIQLVSTLFQTIQHKDVLQELYSAGGVLPFWMEGLHGVIYEKLMYGERSHSLATAVLGTEMFAHSDRIVGQSVTNLSYLSWFVVTPLYAGWYTFYTLCLMFASVVVVKINGATKDSINLLWFIWLMYLMPPWFGSMTTFIYCMVQFWLLRMLFFMIMRKKND